MFTNWTEFRQKFALMAGGGYLTQFQVDWLKGRSEKIFAADGAADALWDAGLTAGAIIGDLDSLQDESVWAARGVPLIRIADQETTDFSKCLDSVQADVSICVGFTGGRLDHTLACITEISRRADRRVVLVGEADLCFVLPGEISFDLSKGETVSLWPVAPLVVEATRGLEWDATGLAMAPDAKIGTSNRALGGEVFIRASGGPLIVFLPLGSLDKVVECLAGITTISDKD